MASDAGLSIKERLAMLQANNRNPQLSGPMKPGPPGPHKTPVAIPKPSPAAPAPAPAATEQNDKPSNGPATPAKPFAALKPALKPPVTAVNNAGDTKEEQPPQLAFKLRSTGSTLDGKGATPVVPNKPKASDTGGGSAAASSVAAKINSLVSAGGVPAVAKKPGDSNIVPLVPKKPVASSQEPANVTNTTTDVAAVTDNSETESPTRTMSIKDRMAALKGKAGDSSVSPPKFANTDSKPQEFPPKKVALFPPKVGGQAAGGGALKPSDLAKSIQDAANRKKASETFLRRTDGKRFRKVSAASVMEGSSAPAKPAPLEDVDLDTFLQAYTTAKEAGDADKIENGEAANGEMDEMYVEAESSSVQLRGKGALKKAVSVRISEIPEFTEEEEEQELYTDGASAEASVAKQPEAPEEEYDDCESMKPAAPQMKQSDEESFDEPDEIYEPLDDDENFPPPESPGPTDDKKGKKEKEKEKDKGGKKKDKAKEDSNKKEEKERKKREEEIKKQRSKFGLKDGDEKVGDGVVKNNAGAGVFTKDLAVSKGEIITILRMDNNPAGKWLVQNEQGKLGFVNSNNIEVATPAIRQLMAAGGDSFAEDGDPEELYEALPEGEMDEIYEEL